MDLILRYPQLDTAARYQVLVSFFGMLILGKAKHEIMDPDMDEFAKSDLDSREIKKLIRLFMC